ncbi:MAG: helix-turn-helix domain-containing protein, partial [Burkholderiales bacterium]|nr:helix-turn-helix domain-containing protein [Burkholderiales bacterium]
MPPVGYKSQIIAAMPGSVPEIMAKSGMNESTVKRWIRIMRAAGESHIGSWKRSNGSGGFQSVHVLGAGQDAPCCLKSFTVAQCCKRSRRNAKVDGRAEFTQA